MAKLLLARHGNTKANSAERFWGQTDVELSEEGTWQAEKLRDRLAAETIDTIYTSSLRRAKVTAEIIASQQKVKSVTCEELREINFGLIEGLTYAEISQRYPDFAAVLADRNSHPHFPDGESQDDLNARVKAFLPRLEKHDSEETVLIVAHSGVLRMMVCNLMGIPIRHWRQFRLNLGSLSILETYAQGAILNLFNDISHLK
ncbi:alpha-ribazole phosphatase [Chloroflexota bacterium]